jgi:hypothetical protein
VGEAGKVFVSCSLDEPGHLASLRKENIKGYDKLLKAWDKSNREISDEINDEEEAGEFDPSQFSITALGLSLIYFCSVLSSSCFTTGNIA